MLTYNRFWHFWSTLDSRHYVRVVTIVAAATLAISLFFFPVVWAIAMVVASIVVVGLVISTLNKLSDFMFNRRNQQLQHLKRKVDPNDTTSAEVQFNQQIDLYLNRRAICPKELLAGQALDLSKGIKKEIVARASIAKPLTLQQDTVLDIEPKEKENRNTGYIASNQNNDRLFIKRSSAMDALSEIAAREMAELTGFIGLIPNNTVAKDCPLDQQLPQQSAKLLYSRQTIAEAVADNPAVKNTPRVQGLISKFIFNLKTAVYRTKAQQGKLSELLYIQELMPDTKDGLKWYLDLFNTGTEKTQSAEQAVRETAKTLLNSIDQTSFEDNFLLQIVLGSQDANPGNTLFADAVNAKGRKTKKMYSIDHELIMPENNYNITSFNEVAIENQFPIRLWLAGLPQAEVPFSKETMIKTLNLLDPNRLLAYHRQKKLFTPAAISAQIERIQLIRSLFVAELQKPTSTLTPRALLLKLVNNHPAYDFLKNGQRLSDFSTFMCLGYIPKGADMSLFRYHLGLASAKNLLFFGIANDQVAIEKTNAAGLAILAETSERLKCGG